MVGLCLPKQALVSLQLRVCGILPRRKIVDGDVELGVLSVGGGQLLAEVDADQVLGLGFECLNLLVRAGKSQLDGL